MLRQKLQAKKDRETGQNVEKDIGEMVAKRVQLPEMVIDGITQHS
jgi:hypothetical protein